MGLSELARTAGRCPGLGELFGLQPGDFRPSIVPPQALAGTMHDVVALGGENGLFPLSPLEHCETYPIGTILVRTFRRMPEAGQGASLAK